MNLKAKTLYRRLSTDLGLTGEGDARGPRNPNGLPLHEEYRHGSQSHTLVRGHQARRYDLPSLADARRKFEGLLGQSVLWDTSSDGADVDEADISALAQRAGFEEL